MTETSSSTCTTVSHDKIVQLNEDIGYMLINKLKGLDAINFMEAVNGSDQFGVIEISDDHFFNVTFMKISKKEIVKVKLSSHHAYLDSLCVDVKGYLYPRKYSDDKGPPIRMFVHPTFTVNAFENLCFTYKTTVFRCYSRLLPFNIYPYVGNLIVVDYFNYKDLIGYARQLNGHERYLFKESTSFCSQNHNNRNNQLNFVQTIGQFMTNFESRFKSCEWIEAIDFNIFHISGGCILNSLCCEPFFDTCDQQVDVNYNGDSYDEFKYAVVGTFSNLISIMSKKNGDHAHNELIKKDNGIYMAKLHFGVTLCFRFKHVSDVTAPISYVLNSSDIDISQIAYTGSQVVCTFAFLQAITTKSFICYTLYEDMTKCVYNRIHRYYQRGFVFLEPQSFNNACYISVKDKTVFDTTTVETREILNDDGEVQTATITRDPSIIPFFNVDPYFLQETFIEHICSQKI